ncbi:MAG: hypothetical protein QGD92_07455 [Gammaproteobacteria bacterium]|nr:hypothetical protein [Gammaproteobacteria bacterium]
MVILLPLILMQQGWTIELYKYVNEDGVTVLDSRIPTRYVRSGYTILSSDGRVLEVVARALTKEEIIERDRLAALELKHRLEREEKEAADANLMRLYSIPEDVIRARDSKLATINGFIKATRTNLQRMVAQKRHFDALAADVERAGGTISQENIDSIQNAAERIEQTEQEISNKLLEIEQVKQAYARDLIRVKDLYGESHTRKSPPGDG